MENIGNGPAMQVRWSLRNSDFAGTISQLRPGKLEEMPFPDAQPLWNAAGNGMIAVVECSYQSLSGRKYSSKTEYDLDKVKIITSFSES